MKRLVLFILTISILHSCYIPTKMEEGDLTITFSDDELTDKRAEELDTLRNMIKEKSEKLAPNILRNGSFEKGYPGASVLPDFWSDCGWISESPADLHESGGVAFSVKHDAVDGFQYVGMVTRSNGTFECIQQELETTINQGVYDLLMVVSRSPHFLSVSQTTGLDAKYSTPVLLEIYGYRKVYGDEVRLYSTEAIESTEWIIIEDLIKVDDDISKIKIGTFFVGDENYNGNVLIDKVIIAKKKN